MNRLLFGLALVLCGCPSGEADLAPLSQPEFPVASDDDSTDPGPCPSNMVPIPGGDTVCIDRFEAALEVWADDDWTSRSPFGALADELVRAVPADGVPPQGYVSGEEAAAACEESGKRLCTSEEWLAACRGTEGLTWPYGDEHQEGACNDTYPGGHPVVDFFGSGDVWDPVSMNDPGINQQPDTLEPGGGHDACVSSAGAYDMHGNLHEWVSDASGVFRGGFYADAVLNGPGCTYATTAHAGSYHDYSTGFRCCW